MNLKEGQENNLNLSYHSGGNDNEVKFTNETNRNGIGLFNHIHGDALDDFINYFFENYPVAQCSYADHHSAGKLGEIYFPARAVLFLYRGDENNTINILNYERVQEVFIVADTRKKRTFGIKKIYLKTQGDNYVELDVVNDQAVLEKVGKKRDGAMEVENNNLVLNLNTVFYGPPGTGKTYGLTEAVKYITGIENDVNGFNNLKAIDEVKSGQIEFITFHQSYAYEDFIEGISAKVTKGQVEYYVKNGLFKTMCRRALVYKLISDDIDEKCCDFYSKNTDEICAAVESGTHIVNAPDNFAEFYSSLRNAFLNNEQSTDETRKFVLCIDEINRGNIASIFGELITLIEESKRFGNGEYLSSKLPHSGDELIVPDNLYILGTMNTADRSLVKLDVALRRRFDFVSRYTDYALISDEQKSVIYSEHSLRDVASKFNHQIRNLKKSNDYELGHYFFMNIDSPDDEYNSFNKKIIPLLHEYFQGSHEQMKKVLNWGGVTWDYDNETHEWRRV
ncbi:McrB family protein [Pseudidiomarina salilacus]|uniref:McrB family protein n=1 Tax=Pseudidiomarina salilacus TaxID=3384452 RepID=UPI003984E620